MDYAALAKQFGGTSAPAGAASAPPVDYAALAKQFGGVSAAAQGDAPGIVSTLGATLGKGVGDVALGAQHYLGKGMQAVGADRAGQWLVKDATTGKANMAAEVAPYKEANPITATIGELAGNVAATLPVGGALALPVKAAAKFVPALQPLGNAIASAGFTTGSKATPGAAGLASNMLTRAAGGAATGGVSAGLVDPDAAATGAVVGAALPPVIAGLGKAGAVVATKWRNMRAGGDAAGAAALVKALGAASPTEQAAIVQQLREAEMLVPGSAPTVGQALRTPKASTLEQVVSDTPGGEGLKDIYLAQNMARMNALEGVAPTQVLGVKQAKTDAGVAIGRYAQQERGMANTANTAQYRSVDPQLASRTPLPVAQMTDAADTFIGSGAVGKNQAPYAFAKEAADISKPVTTPASALVDAKGIPFTPAKTEAQAARWDEVMRMRASLNEQAVAAGEKGEKQAAAALWQQKAALDKSIENSLPPEMRAKWLEANSSHAAMGQRFDTGPQAALFQTRNGAPLVQGDEIANKFWHGASGLSDDVKAFRRLVDDNPAMLGQFRSMLTTEGASTQTAGGNLSAKFPKWLEQHLPGLQEAFDPKDVKALQNIAADIRRSAAADAAGASKGSPTYRNSANALSLGWLDSPWLDKTAQFVPIVRNAASPALASMRAFGHKGKAESLAGVMSNSGQAANAIERLIARGASKKEVNALAQLLGVSANRVAPVAWVGAAQ